MLYSRCRSMENVAPVLPSDYHQRFNQGHVTLHSFFLILNQMISHRVLADHLFTGGQETSPTILSGAQTPLQSDHPLGETADHYSPGEPHTCGQI